MHQNIILENFKTLPTMRANPKKGREATAPLFIKEIQEVQGGKKRYTMVVQSSPKMPK
jgi:hypothetical protein